MYMEQDAENIRKALSMYTPIYIFIRDCGTKDRFKGLTKVSLPLENKKFHIRFGNTLDVMVDDEVVWCGEFNDSYFKGFSCAYERVDAKGVMYFPPYPHDTPNNPTYPHVQTSMLRNIIDNHLIEVTFKEKIELEKEQEFWKIK